MNSLLDTMNIAERRHRTQKIINKRLKIAKKWGMDNLVFKYPHIVHKWNYTCDCHLCSLQKGHYDSWQLEKFNKIAEAKQKLTT